MKNFRLSHARRAHAAHRWGGGRCAAILCLGFLLQYVAPTPVVVAAIAIDTVPVRNMGNGNDPIWLQIGLSPRWGSVAYPYRIGTYEVTVGQYTAFLNAVAATDTYGLYDTRMATDLNIAGIAQSGSSGSYIYSVIGSPNHPVTYVSWGDAARFVNWLHNGQPTGAQSYSTTEVGSYELRGATTSSGYSLANRNSRATWWIPTEDEWYKAAYHQPADQGGDSDNYWFYATRTNSIPYAVLPPGSAAPVPSNTGNFGSVAGPSPYSTTDNYLTDVGAYTQSSSFYGTFDQGATFRSGPSTRMETVRAALAVAGASARTPPMAWNKHMPKSRPRRTLPDFAWHISLSLVRWR